MKSAALNGVSVKCCGTCKWLDVPAGDLTKSGRTHKRVDLRMFFCRVPFTKPPVPASVRVQWNDDPDYRMMCPKYGTDCAFHEERQCIPT